MSKKLDVIYIILDLDTSIGWKACFEMRPLLKKYDMYLHGTG